MSARGTPNQQLPQRAPAVGKSRRGKLTLFFGAAAGVGKTYSMLQAARAERELGRDVVIGVIDTHGRAETAALALGIAVIARRKFAYRGVLLEELDLDAVLVRHPGIVLVDELAHANAPGARHRKRWQDVEDLLDAGIDVYTTLDVQRIESLKDVIAQITGIVVRETVPDHMFDEADEIRLIDLSTDDLLERLHEGKVYVAQQAQLAARHFFRRENLIALRELGLRKTAGHLDEQVRAYKASQGVQRAWPVAERILVCVSPSPESASLVRAARRLAAGLHAEWIAMYVEPPATRAMSDAGRERVAQSLRLAEQLGAETVCLSGSSAAEETIRYARSRNVSKVVVGKPTHARWRDLVQQPFIDALVRRSPDIDVYVINGERGSKEALAEHTEDRRLQWGGVLAATVGVALATMLSGLLFGPSQLPDVVMTYLLVSVIISMRFGVGASIVATLLSVVTFDFLFVPPYGTLRVTDGHHVVTFAMLLIVGGVSGVLTGRVRQQAKTARQREMRTARLYAMSRELASTPSTENLSLIAARHLQETFQAAVVVLVPNLATDQLQVAAASAQTLVLPHEDVAVAAWVWSHQKPAGPSTDTLSSASALFLPLRGARGKVGVLGLRFSDPSRLVNPAQRQLLGLFVSQIAAALERARLVEAAQRDQLQIEAERLRSSLLSSVSHDLRTPLGVITGAASMLEDEAHIDVTAKRDLIATIREEADRLSLLVRNLLDMTKLTAGALQPNKQLHPFDEVVGVALTRLEGALRGRQVNVHVAPELPPVPIDIVLIEQALINLLENALKYTPDRTPIDISARVDSDTLVVQVADRGPGIPVEERERVFDKFYRLARAGTGGSGLGLAICRGVIEAHGGRIWIEGREGSGAQFFFALPLEMPPQRPAS